jgi:negative regulator of flagellin synthesis FlgM
VAVSLNGLDGMDVSSASAQSAGKTQASTGAQQGHAQQTGTAPQGDAVQITGVAAQLAQLEKSLSAAPAIDTSRVQAVSQALASGAYTVQADKVAAGLMQSDQFLGRLPGAKE